jgi:hypothetical protein
MTLRVNGVIAPKLSWSLQIFMYAISRVVTDNIGPFV